MPANPAATDELELPHGEVRVVRDAPEVGDLVDATKVAQELKELLTKDEELGALYHNLLLLYRMRVLFISNLRDALARHGKQPEDGHEQLMLTVTAQAAQDSQFTREQVLNAASTNLLAYLATDNDREKARIHEAELALLREKKSVRAQQPLPLGFTLAGAPHIPRDRTTLLVGSPAVLAVLLDRVMLTAANYHAAGEPSIAVLRLATSQDVPRLPTTRKESRQKRCLQLGPEKWRDQIDGAKSVERLLAPVLRFMYQTRVDLLITDDLPGLIKVPSSTANRDHAAARVHRDVRNWVDNQVGGLLAGYPTTPGGDLPTAAELLRTFANVHRVEFRPDENGALAIWSGEELLVSGVDPQRGDPPQEN